MSGLAGVVHLDGRPVDREAFAAMVAATAHRGPDRTDQWVDGAVAMAHVLHRSVDEARTAAQPIVVPDRHLVVTFDGRIDDRAGLRAALGSVDRPLGADAELAVAAYLRWGADGFARMVGDFAVVVWDGRDRRLVATRDPLGHRPLHYSAVGLALRWASEVAGVLADPAVPRRPDAGALAERLANRPQTVDATVWADVRRLPPGHVLVADASGVRTDPGWRWTVRPPRTDVPEAELVEELRSTLATAVADRLAGVGPVTLQLSGGLDSSTVVGFAAEVARTTPSLDLRLASLVFPGRPSDEGPYIDAMCDHVGWPSERIEPGPLGWDHVEAEVQRTLVLPAPPTQAMHGPLLDSARAAGSHVLVTGHGGDEWFSGSALALADDLRHLRLRGLRDRVRQDQLLWASPSATRHVVRHGLVPLLPAPWQRRALRRRAPAAALAPWLRPSFVREVGLDDRLRPAPVAGPARAAADVVQRLADAGRIDTIETVERATAAHGLELRSPFDDRRVVELALGLPDRVLRRNGGTRWAVRLATAGVVPDVIRQRGGKATFRQVVVEALAAPRSGPAGVPQLAGLGWVDDGALLQAEREVLANHAAGRVDHRMWQIWAAHTIERWLELR